MTTEYLVEIADSTMEYGWKIEAATPVHAVRRALLEAAHDSITFNGSLEIHVRPIENPLNTKPWWKVW